MHSALFKAFQVAGRRINNLRYVDANAVLYATSEADTPEVATRVTGQLKSRARV